MLLSVVIPVYNERETLLKITSKELLAIAEREGLERDNLHLRWTDAALEKLAIDGFDRRYGARPLQRTLERMVVTPIARLLVDWSGLLKVCAEAS